MTENEEFERRTRKEENKSLTVQREVDYVLEIEGK